MRVKVLHALLALAAAGPPWAARGADALPIASGRWSTGECTHADPAAVRWFASGVTASFDDRCRVTAERGVEGFYQAHLACRYRAARPDGTDIVIEVVSGTSLRWVHQCSATLYRFCGRGEMPILPGSAPR